MTEPLRRAPLGRRLWPTAVFSAYLLLSAIATWPLLRDMRTTIASDAADPVLNASILLWNATTTPFSREWWNPPHYYPSEGVAAFTENLVGISPIASPIYWLTGNPLLAYNFSVFLTWPLSAFAAYLLVRFLTAREDAAFLAGLSFGFSPYRVVAMPHIQTLATFGVALYLLGMHGYLERRRWTWLVLVGVGWVQQSFANGYYTVYGGFIVGLWLLYFCTRRDTWKPGLVLVGTLAVSSLPLAPMLLRYRAIHEQYGLHRAYTEILYFSAMTHSWFETHDQVWLWHSLFPPGKDDMFPGLTAVAMTIAGVLWLLLQRRPDDVVVPAGRRRLRRWLGAGTVVSVAAILVNLVYGRIDTSVGGIPIKMTDMARAVVLLLACGIPLLALTPRTRLAVERRSPLVFYVAATIVIALLSCGPELRAGEDVVWKPAPYGWLMALPGFNELRVPTQIKMIDILCLAVAAGLAYHAIRPARARLAVLVCAIAAVGLWLDGWMVHAQMVTAPVPWPAVEPPDRTEPILELPMGGVDYAATFRAAAHHRRVLNGVSGYDPPHYFALKSGLEAHDPTMLSAIASLGAFDIVVNGDEDPDGIEARYAAGAPGAVRVSSDGRRTLFRVPKSPPDPSLGEPWPITDVRTLHHEDNASLMLDGDVETGWADLPKDPDAWVLADLGAVREIGGVTEMIGDYPMDFPRRLVIELSVDGETWERVFDGPTFAQTFLGFVREVRRAALRFSFEAKRGRYIRLRETERPTNWRFQELRVHAPARPER